MHTDCDLIGYFVIHFFRYWLWILLTWIIVIEFQWNSDFVMHWYEFYPILILLIIKMILQISYTFGPKYSEESELKHRIHDMLMVEFGDISEIIETYLPRFNPNNMEQEMNVELVHMAIETKREISWT